MGGIADEHVEWAVEPLKTKINVTQSCLFSTMT